MGTTRTVTRQVADTPGRCEERVMENCCTRLPAASVGTAARNWISCVEVLVVAPRLTLAGVSDVFHGASDGEIWRVMLSSPLPRLIATRLSATEPPGDAVTEPSPSIATS